MRWSYQLLPEQRLDELLSTLELLDDLGFWACYGADETYHKDMWALFAAGAARTSRLRLGPEVAGIILKDPTLVAQQIATLDELTGGRAELVFSTGTSHCSSNTTCRQSTRRSRSSACGKRTR